MVSRIVKSGDYRERREGIRAGKMARGEGEGDIKVEKDTRSFTHSLTSPYLVSP